MERKTPRPRRGYDAVEAVVDERDLRERMDEPDGSYTRPGDYELDAAARLTGDQARRAAATDVYTSDEALDDVARRVGMEFPDVGDDDYDRE